MIAAIVSRGNVPVNLRRDRIGEFLPKAGKTKHAEKLTEKINIQQPSWAQLVMNGGRVVGESSITQLLDVDGGLEDRFIFVAQQPHVEKRFMKMQFNSNERNGQLMTRVLTGISTRPLPTVTDAGGTTNREAGNYLSIAFAFFSPKVGVW